MACGRLVLSIFPGLGLLDRAFEEEGWCVVRGPDLLWGGDIKQFVAPPRVFDGVIGGPPCQCFSRLVAIVRHNGYKVGENLIPEFERVVTEAHPSWFLMENVLAAPLPEVPGYWVDDAVLDNRWLGGVQSRKHRFAFGSLRRGARLQLEPELHLENAEWDYRVCASDARRTPVKKRQGGKDKRTRRGALGARGRVRRIPEMLRLQGLPEDFFAHSPFTVRKQGEMLGNGVPLPMGRAVARAVARATEL